MNTHRCPKATRAAFLTILLGIISFWTTAVWAIL
jgi:hypothetical protein